MPYQGSVGYKGFDISLPDLRISHPVIEVFQQIWFHRGWELLHICDVIRQMAMFVSVIAGVDSHKSNQFIQAPLLASLDRGHPAARRVPGVPCNVRESQMFHTYAPCI
jgi:hypothetical protein